MLYNNALQNGIATRGTNHHLSVRVQSLIQQQLTIGAINEIFHVQCDLSIG